VRHACLESLEKLGIGALVTIGGDDTAFSAFRLAEAAGGGLRVAHVPKTIDNDLPLPGSKWPSLVSRKRRRAGGRWSLEASEYTPLIASTR
jgi:Phosphofructokinase